MTPLPILPDGLELVRTTPEFDQHTTPAGLLGAHRTAPDVWGRLVVHTGETSFAFLTTVAATNVLASASIVVHGW